MRFLWMKICMTQGACHCWFWTSWRDQGWVRSLAASNAVHSARVAWCRRRTRRVIWYSEKGSYESRHLGFITNCNVHDWLDVLYMACVSGEQEGTDRYGFCKNDARGRPLRHLIGSRDLISVIWVEYILICMRSRKAKRTAIAVVRWPSSVLTNDDRGGVV